MKATNRYGDGVTAAHLYRVLSEPAEIWIGLIRSATDVIRCLDDLTQRRFTNLFVVVHSRWVADALRLRTASDRVHVAADFLTLVWIPEASQHEATPAHDLWHLLRSPRSNVYQISRDAQATLINTLSSVRAGDTVALLWPAECGLDSIIALASQRRGRLPRWFRKAEESVGAEFPVV